MRRSPGQPLNPHILEENNNKTGNSPGATAEQRRERAVMVAVIRDNQPPAQVGEYLDELQFLAETADIECVRRFTQDRKSVV